MAQQAKQANSSLAHKVLTVVGIVLCVILVPVLAINVTLIVKGFTNSDEVPAVGGTFPLIVLTDSMTPEIQSGDLIICHTVDSADVKVGDVISFYDPDGNGQSVVTHRVVEVSTGADGAPEWTTKGDANNTNDQAKVPASKLVGAYQWRIPGLGNVAMFMQTTQGLIVCVVLPIVLLIGYDVLRRRRYEKQRQSDTDALMGELEQLRAEKQQREQNDR